MGERPVPGATPAGRNPCRFLLTPTEMNGLRLTGGRGSAFCRLQGYRLQADGKQSGASTG